MDLYSASMQTPLMRSDMDHTVLPANNTISAVGSDVGQINEVTLHRARLVLGWVTVSECKKFISV